MSPFWIDITKAFWCGCAALGFGVLFNIPPRALTSVWIGGFIAGLAKYTLLDFVDLGVVFSTFAACTAIGFASIPIAHIAHVPPNIFAVPSVIPLIPGVSAYRSMLGIIKLTGPINSDYSKWLYETVNHGATTMFIILAIGVGVTIPMHITRKDSVKKMKLKLPL